MMISLLLLLLLLFNINKFDSAGAKLLNECFHIYWMLYNGIYIAMETNNCNVSIYTAFGNSWCDVWKDSDGNIKKD